MELKKKMIAIFIAFFFMQETMAGIITTVSLGFARYRNQNSPHGTKQPVGFSWGLAAGYRYQFISLEAMTYRYSGSATNDYLLVEYKTKATDKVTGVLLRLYFLEVFNIIAGYAEHDVNHSITPNDSFMANYYRYDAPNKSRGFVYGLGGKKNLSGSIDLIYEAIVMAIGNGGRKVSSELDIFTTGIRYEF